ncbi:MAG: hypothetical protein JSW07_12370 [bacterium]|nr:MAG: hypothetical protein JSW07_12370 [bacterium]
MNVNIHANKIEKILNADTISIDEIYNLKPTEKVEMIQHLISAIEKQLILLMRQPIEISSDQIKSFAIELNTLLEESKIKIAPHRNRKDKTKNFFETVRSCFGSTTDIILNIIKLSQVLGNL